MDLARLAKLQPGGVICEIMNEDGTMARVPQLTAFCEKHGLKMISVASLIRYRHRTERFLERRGEGCLRTAFGDFKTVTFVSTLDGEQHIALVRGEVAGQRERAGADARPLRRGRRFRLDRMRLPRGFASLA